MREMLTHEPDLWASARFSSSEDIHQTKRRRVRRAFHAGIQRDSFKLSSDSSSDRVCCFTLNRQRSNISDFFTIMLGLDLLTEGNLITVFSFPETNCISQTLFVQTGIAHQDKVLPELLKTGHSGVKVGCQCFQAEGLPPPFN